LANLGCDGKQLETQGSRLLAKPAFGLVPKVGFLLRENALVVRFPGGEKMKHYARQFMSCSGYRLRCRELGAQAAVVSPQIAMTAVQGLGSLAQGEGDAVPHGARPDGQYLSPADAVIRT
jgi:hypothetical protein